MLPTLTRSRLMAEVAPLLAVVVISLCTTGQLVAPAIAGAEAERPSFAIAFTRQTVKENDAFELEVWLRNEKDQDLIDVELQMAGPVFLRLHDALCNDRSRSAVTGSVSLGRVPPSLTVKRRLCLRSERAITPGDFNLVFSVSYAWEHKGKRHESFVTVEKPLKARLFGTESIAGIPLHLAAFVVPGLVFWLALSGFGVSWAHRIMAQGDRMVYSLLVSVLLLVLGGMSNFLDPDGAIGIANLGGLALAGLGGGVVVGSVNHGARWLLQLHRRGQWIRPGDDLYTKLRKLLSANRGYRHPRATVTVEGKEYVGALAADMGGTLWLAGWFRLSVPTSSGSVVARIRRNHKAARVQSVLRTARKHSLNLVPRDSIRQIDAGGFRPTGDSIRSWPAGKIHVEEDPEGRPVLDLIETPGAGRAGPGK